MSHRNSWIVFAILVAASVELCAVGVPRLDIQKLVDSAEVIAIGQVFKQEERPEGTVIHFGGKSYAARQFSNRVRVRAVLKGTCPDQLAIHYALPLEFLGFLPLREGPRILFLVRAGDNYQPIDPFHPDLPATSNSENMPPAPDRQDAATEVFHELADVLASANTPAVTKFEILQKDYAIPTDPYLLSALKRGIAVAMSQEREALQAELLIRGDISQLPAVAEALSSNAVTSEGKSRLLYAIANRLEDPHGLPALRRLASSSDPSVRAATAEALWHLRDPTTTDMLVHMLSDSDPNVRYYVIRALAEVTGQEMWSPSIPEFQQHEGLYMEHWKKWAIEEGFAER